ncbi:type II toxin-antitoxin system RelB/DinJ family antitoxin [Hydrogenobaculum acidophilum]
MKRASIVIDENTYAKSKKIFEEYGLTFNEAIRLILSKISDDEVVKLIKPAEYIPSSELIKRIKNVEQGKNMDEYEDVNELFDKLDL